MDGIIIVLGAPNDEHGELSSIAKERCEQAIIEYRKHPGYKILPTGGYGPHFNVTEKPHAYYAKCYLVSRGIPQDDILEFAESSNTVKDAQLSRAIVEKYGVRKVMVVTSDFHLGRAQCIFQSEYSGIEPKFSGCYTNLPQDELDVLKQHEEEALARLLRQGTEQENLALRRKVNGYIPKPFNLRDIP